MAVYLTEKGTGAGWLKVRKSDGQWIAIKVSKMIAVEDQGCDIGDCPEKCSICFDSRVGCTTVGVNQRANAILNAITEE